MKKNFVSIVGFIILSVIMIFFVVTFGGLFWTMGQTDFSMSLKTGRPILDRPFSALRLSFVSATISTIIAILLSIPSGYLLSRRNFLFKKIAELILLMPMVISPVAIGALLLIFFNTSIGKFVEKIIGRVVFEPRGIVVAQVVMISGLAITLMKTIFDYTGREYEETARTLGCNETETFLRVTLPLASKGILSATVLVWARALGEFGATVTLAGATTYKTETLPVAIYLALASADIYQTGVLIILSFTMALGVLFILKLSMDKKG